MSEPTVLQFAKITLCALLALSSNVGCSTANNGHPSASVSEMVDSATADVIDRQHDIDDMVTECMALQGFDYKAPRDDLDIESVGIYRIGVLSPYFHSDRADLGWTTSLIDRIVDILVIEDRSEIPDGEKAAYNSALLGTPQEDGCLLKAQEEFPEFERFSALVSQLDSLNQQIMDEISLSAEAYIWMHCMAEIASVDKSNITIDYAYERLVKQVGDLLLGSEGFANLIASPDESTALELNLDKSTNRFLSLDPAIQSELDRIYDMEEELVTADRECAETSDLTTTAEQIRDRAEAEMQSRAFREQN